MERELWDRNELYELVWSRPMTDLAKEYVISDVGLRKVCLKLQIPIPKAGYWAKLRSGQKIKRPSLPPQTDTTTVEKPEKRTAEKDSLYNLEILDHEKRDSYLAAMAFERMPENFIRVRSDQPQHEETVQRALAIIKANGAAKCREAPKDALDMRVSSSSLDRAAAIMDALVFAFHQRGWDIAIRSDKEHRGMYVKLFDTEIPCWLEEHWRSVPHVLTPEEEKDKKKNPWKYERQIIDSEATGLIAFRIDSPYSFGSNHIRGSWADGTRQRLENVLNKVCTGLVIAAIEARNGEIRHAEWERDRQEEERKREKARRIRQIEKARQINLMDDIEAYEAMLRIKRYISFIRECIAKDGREIEPDLAKWLSWAEEQEKRHNPLANGFPKFAVEPAKEEDRNPFWQWSVPEPEPKNWFARKWYDKK